MPFTHFSSTRPHQTSLPLFLSNHHKKKKSNHSLASKKGKKVSVMGGSASKKKQGKSCERDVRSLTEKLRIVREEINEMMNEREKESRAYERGVMVFAIKEAEWKRERKRLKEEVKKLRKIVEEKEERVRGMEDYGRLDEEKSEKELQLLGSSSFLVEQMREERARRDETVEKWKQLYLAIKTELDDLIQRTNGDGLYWRAEEEDMMEELRKEVKAKEETIEVLKAGLASMENEEYKKEREIDILRQSLRIMSSKKVSHVAKSLHQCS